MIYKWESEEERILRFMKISPLKKLEWLYQMNKFMSKFSSKRQKIIQQKLRESPYTAIEWEKIERLASAKGKVYKSVKRAKKHIEAL